MYPDAHYSNVVPSLSYCFPFFLFSLFLFDSVQRSLPLLSHAETNYRGRRNKDGKQERVREKGVRERAEREREGGGETKGEEWGG